ncbi:MAG: spore coat protein [Firmicutes bacterium]|nr:spore coat protein [Bacillota bacterium]
MDDKLMIENYLLVLKSTVEVFIHGTLESSNNDVREVLKNSLNDILNCQANTYDEMVKYGWYNVNNVDSSNISDTLNKVKSSN